MPKKYNSATAPKLFLGTEHIFPLWPVPKITDYLLKKYGTAEKIKANEALMKKAFGVLRYGHICKELEERAYRESRTVITNTVITGEDNSEPFEGMLKVESRSVHHLMTGMCQLFQGFLMTLTISAAATMITSFTSSKHGYSGSATYKAQSIASQSLGERRLNMRSDIL